ncbi:MAG: sec-independent translocase [Pseudonocardiaceae bacterium]
MFNIGGFEFLVLVVVGLFVFGPERLPAAASWLARTIRQVREYASGARNQLRSELGPEFDELRQPLADLQRIRSFNPRRSAVRHLFDDLDDLDEEFKPNGYAAPIGWGTPVSRPLQPGERAPFDPDAT